MPVRRFRSVAEMEQPHWREPGDPKLFQAIAALWATGAAVVRHRFPPGVYRHASVESLNALTEEWAQANFRAFHTARTPGADGAASATEPPAPAEELKHWVEDFEAAATRPLRLRMRYAFIKTYRPVLDDEPFRAFERMADYRAWCETALPSWLGYGRV